MKNWKEINKDVINSDKPKNCVCHKPCEVFRNKYMLDSAFETPLKNQKELLLWSFLHVHGQFFSHKQRYHHVPVFHFLCNFFCHTINVPRKGSEIKRCLQKYLPKFLSNANSQRGSCCHLDQKNSHSLSNAANFPSKTVFSDIFG